MYRMLAAPGPLVLVGTAGSHWPRWTMKPACVMNQFTAKAGVGLGAGIGLWEPLWGQGSGLPLPGPLLISDGPFTSLSFGRPSVR